jgi:hypothetical protein
MASINGIAGSFSGTVAYNDGSNGHFNAEMKTDMVTATIYNADTDEGKVVTADIDVSNSSEWTFVFARMISNLPFISTFSWGSSPVSGKTIADLVMNLRLMITLDDNKKYPVNMVYDFGSRKFYTESESDLISTSDNSTDVIDKLASMLNSIMDASQPVIT